MQKNRRFISIATVIITLILVALPLYAWSPPGATFDYIGRETILRTAKEMVDYSWSPAISFDNWRNGITGTPAA
jgi:hypothetical protein